VRFSVETSGENTGAEMERAVGRVEVGIGLPTSIFIGERSSSDDGVFPLVVISRSRPVKFAGMLLD
jgi:hypothetical protein